VEDFGVVVVGVEAVVGVGGCCLVMVDVGVG